MRRPSSPCANLAPTFRHPETSAVPDTPFDDSEVHVLDARSARRGLGPWIAGFVVLIALGGVGAWVALTDPFLESQAVATAPPADDNELGEAWSFETTDTTDARSEWTQSDDAPAGFAFLEAAAVSGQLGAGAAPEAGEWAEIASRPVSLGMHKGGVELGARAAGGDVQLVARFESDGRPPIDFVASSGTGELVGLVPVPPGSEAVRAVLRAYGEASVDDVVVRLVDRSPASVESRGVYGALVHGGTLVVSRGSEPAFVVEPPSLRGADDTTWPPGVGWLVDDGVLLSPDGRRMSMTPRVSTDGPRLVLSSEWGSGAEGATVVRTARVLGALADGEVGVSSASSGFQRYDDDFTVADALWFTLGRTQDRLVMRVGEPVPVSGARRADGSFELRVAVPAGAGARGLTLQTSFTDERVRVVARRDEARAHLAAGDLGAALAEVEGLLRDDPYDDDVLREAGAMRAELVATMQARLDAIDADLEDALFLASAARCREVLADCEAAAATFAGSSAEARFEERAAVVRERAALLLEAARAARAERLDAIATSFEEFGGHDLLSGEYRDTLDRWLGEAEAPPAEAGDEEGSR